MLAAPRAKPGCKCVAACPDSKNPDTEHVVGLSLQSVPTSAPPPITLVLTHALHACTHIYTAQMHFWLDKHSTEMYTHTLPTHLFCKCRPNLAKGTETHTTVPRASALILPGDTLDHKSNHSSRDSGTVDLNDGKDKRKYPNLFVYCYLPKNAIA